jgi:hypothetical protein
LEQGSGREAEEAGVEAPLDEESTVGLDRDRPQDQAPDGLGAEDDDGREPRPIHDDGSLDDRDPRREPLASDADDDPVGGLEGDPHHPDPEGGRQCLHRSTGFSGSDPEASVGPRPRTLDLQLGNGQGARRPGGQADVAQPPTDGVGMPAEEVDVGGDEGE